MRWDAPVGRRPSAASTMRRTLKQTLAQYTDDATIISELHDVPPYRVYSVSLGGQRAVLKIDDHPRGHAADEGRVHEYVATHTSAAVPAVLGVGSDHYLTDWHDDIATAGDSIDTDWAHAAGVWLGTLHADTAGKFDGFGRLRDCDGALECTAHDDWTDAVTARIAYHRPFLESIGYGDVADAVNAFFHDYPDVFDGTGEPVLCHGDVHPEHVVRTATGVVLGIDFEHALVAPAEYDYWRTVMPYFEAREDVDETVTRAFRDGYESVRSLPNDIEDRRPVYRLVNWVAFIESLYLQEMVGPTKRAKAGEWMRNRVFETLEMLRETSR